MGVEDPEVQDASSPIASPQVCTDADPSESAGQRAEGLRPKARLDDHLHD